ncbi:SRPBCC family protein [Oryzihumus leptocrescens]|uniref:Polyketide cyclase/dehydrase/lipid transport protein n=1 Tax=Oryzihumus leptocrescens TaxID=297536 RepID=A0A542ZFB9_9MICO|nr:SRPBCC family protein [Oryzihumus leptocrescens]TQL59024.1 polyketide cyclase/dehydrase/lipid transport protein [Oryzihumus leptocrescens]
MPDLRETLDVAAPADLVYDLVADLPRMGDWSPECEKVTWRGGATEAAKGAEFIGHNRAGSIRWVTQGRVVSAERGRNLAFEITFGPMPVARWEYFIVPTAHGCTVVEEWTDRRPGWYRVPADKAFGPRLKTNRRGIHKTLENLKRAAERLPA